MCWSVIIVIAGHYDCGAVRAATRRQDLGLLENWLRQIRDVYRLHREHLDQYSVSELTVDSVIQFIVETFSQLCGVCYFLNRRTKKSAT